MDEFSVFKGRHEMRIMHDPRRKKPCLFIRDEDGSYCKVASFNNEYAAEVFVDYLVELFDGHLKKED